MNKRGGVFYIIDAFLASGIVTIALIVILSAGGQQAVPNDAKNALINYMNFFEKTKIYAAQGEIADDLYNQSLISNQRENLFDAVAELMIHGNITNATNLVKEQTQIILPVQFGMYMKFDDKLVYNRSYNKFSSADISFTRKQIITWFEPAKTNIRTLPNQAASNAPFNDNCESNFGNEYKCVNVQSGIKSYPDLCHKDTTSSLTYNVNCTSFQEANLYSPSVIEVTVWA